MLIFSEYEINKYYDFYRDYKYPITISGSSTTWTPLRNIRSGKKFWRVLARVYIQTKKRIVYTSIPKYEDMWR
ncbi:uncharacterized protein LOC143238703 isoform X2 [Tachypleus tridentatus]|uniref:uncharacterized protein LOC143238703 isoform X2 n=1 Tax=Tachypleus tridentatus TaxID=6853 RepID=UPI003FD27A1F